MRFHFLKIIFILILFSIVVLGCHKKNHPPYTPYTPSGPSSGVTGISYQFTALAIDPDYDSLAIRFDWGNGETSGWSKLAATGDSIEMSFSWSVPDTFYVKAKAKDNNENTSNWSLPLSIIIVQNQPPNIPSVPSGPSVGYTDNFYLFSSTANNPVGDSVSLRFYWGDGDTSEWSNPVLNRFPVLRAHFWLYPNTYHVKAQAKGTAGEISEWSEAHQIIISSRNVLSIEKFNYQSNNDASW